MALGKVEGHGCLGELHSPMTLLCSTPPGSLLEYPQYYSSYHYVPSTTLAMQMKD